MFVSERFLSRLAKLRKTHREAPLEEQIELVHQAFRTMLNDLPDDMVEELFEHITDRIIERSEDSEAFIDQARYLADVADLFSFQYDEENDPIHPNDWQLIGEVVNDFALDMDMQTLNYVMTRVVDHGGI